MRLATSSVPQSGGTVGVVGGWARNRWVRYSVPLALGVALWFVPAPVGVDPAGMHLLAIFVATIVGIILKPLPMGAVALVGIAATAVTGTLAVEEALSGFSNRVIWLIVLAFFISRGFIKTGLGARIAYHFMALLGRRSLGLGYGLVATDLVLAPAIPSNTARAGGVVFPILRSVAEAYDSRPDDGTAGRMGAFLTVVAFQGTVVTSAMFLTAMAANPLAAELASAQGIEITWVGWAVAASVPGFLSLVLGPLLLYRLFPPEVLETPGAAALARQHLEELGPLKGSEWIMLGCFGLLLTLWILSGPLRIHTTTTALLGLVVLLVTGVLTWGDVLRESGAWDTLVWFSALVMMASYLTELGLIPLVQRGCGGGVWRFWLGQRFPVSEPDLLLLPLFLRFEHGPRECHVRSLPGCRPCGGNSPSARGPCPGLFQQPFQLHDPLRHGSGPSPLWGGVRGSGRLVAAGIAGEPSQRGYLAGGGKPLVEGVGALVRLPDPALDPAPAPPTPTPFPDPPAGPQHLPAPPRSGSEHR